MLPAAADDVGPDDDVDLDDVDDADYVDDYYDDDADDAVKKKRMMDVDDDDDDGHCSHQFGVIDKIPVNFVRPNVGLVSDRPLPVPPIQPLSSSMRSISSIVVASVDHVPSTQGSVPF